MIRGGRAAVFLDRDNTLIEDPGYLRDPDRVRLLPGVAKALVRLREAGFSIIVVTNQSGVARDCQTEDELRAVHRRLSELLQAQGVALDAIYYCPFLDGPEAVVERYRRDSELRKPKPGMLLLAAEDHAIDLARSWMIGDSRRDIEAGRAAGCRTILIGGDGTKAEPSCGPTARDLEEAVDLLLEAEGAEPRNLGVDAGPSSVGEGLDSSSASQERPAGRSDADGRSSKGRGDTLDRVESLLSRVLEELRGIRREGRYAEFSIAQLAAAVAQAFALCAIGWGLVAAVNGNPAGAQIRLLAGIAFQVMALTGFALGRRR